MTRIIRPTTAHYYNPPSSTLNQPRPPDPEAVKQLQAILDAPEDTAEEPSSSQQRSATPALHPYLTQVYTSLVQAHRQHSQNLKSQGRQEALDIMAEDGFIKAHIMAGLAKHANNPQALAGFFDALGPQNTLNAFAHVDHHDGDVIGPSGYAPLVDPAMSHLWAGKGHLQEIHSLEARHRNYHREQRETLADALSKAITGGLSDDFIQNLAHTASTTTQTANQLNEVLAQSDDAALVPLKDALLDTLLTPQKALNPISNADTQGWVRAATVLLGDNASDQWIETLQDQVGSAGLSQFIETAVQGTVNITGLDGLPYGDEGYQQGIEGLLSGLSQLQGEEHTELKAHVFSAASDAMGETHTRKELIEGLKALFVSDPKGIAMEISYTSNNIIQSPTAFTFLFKETIFRKPNLDNGFIKAVSSTLKNLYQDASSNELSEAKNASSARTLGHIFGSLKAAFEGAKADNQTDQETLDLLQK
jgi:hypothetical protein